MVLLQLINHSINRYIPANWLSAKREFASTEKFFQVSPPLARWPPLELEAQTGSKIFSDDYVHWWNFSTSLVELFCRKSSETLGFYLFSYISKPLWTEWVAYLFFAANFTLISEEWLWPLEYLFNWKRAMWTAGCVFTCRLTPGG